MRTGHDGEIVLITGYPGYKARRFVEHVLALEPGVELLLLVHPRHGPRAQAEVERLAPIARTRVRLIAGDPVAIDFGLSGAEYLALARAVHVVYHLYQVSDFGVSRAAAEVVNVGGMREIIEFGRVCRTLRQIVHFSSVLVSGDHKGLFLEGDLDVGQSFPSASAKALARAERMLQKERGRLPFIILRPGIALGEPDAEFEALQLLHTIVVFIVGAPEEVGFPLPLREDVRLYIVPWSFVIEMAHLLGTGLEASDSVLQLVDAESPSVHRLVEFVVAECGKRLAPVSRAGALTRGLFGAAGFGLLRKSPRALFDLLNTPVLYGIENTRPLLARYGKSCPHFQSTVSRLVQAIRASQREGRPAPPRLSEAEEFAG